MYNENEIEPFTGQKTNLGGIVSPTSVKTNVTTISVNSKIYKNELKKLFSPLIGSDSRINCDALIRLNSYYKSGKNITNITTEQLDGNEYIDLLRKDAKQQLKFYFKNKPIKKLFKESILGSANSVIVYNNLLKYLIEEHPEYICDFVTSTDEQNISTIYGMTIKSKQTIISNKAISQSKTPSTVTIEKCFRDQNIELIVGFIDLYKKSTLNINHKNAVFIDKTFKKIIHFEPKYYEINIGRHKLTRDEIFEQLNDLVGENLKELKYEYIKINGNQSNFKIFYRDWDYCNVYSIYATLLFALNYKIFRNNLDKKTTQTSSLSQPFLTKLRLEENIRNRLKPKGNIRDRLKTQKRNSLWNRTKRLFTRKRKQNQVNELLNNELANNEIKNVYWIRHGISCNNINSDVNKFRYALKTRIFGESKITHNPSLTRYSMKGSCWMGDKINDDKTNNINIDIVFCSPLMRAIQTAILMFPQHYIDGKIKIINGVSEIGYTGNKPDSKENTIKILKDWLLYIKNNIDIPYPYIIPQGSKCKELNITNNEKLINSLFDFYEAKNKDYENDINVIKNISRNFPDSHSFAIISHGNYIKKYVAPSYPKLKHNQILEKTYNSDNNISKINNFCFNSTKNKIDCLYKDKKETFTEHIIDKKICKKDFKTSNGGFKKVKTKKNKNKNLKRKITRKN